MSFIPRDLESCNKDLIKFLENDIYLALKNASLYMRMKTCLSKRWFGDNSPFWIHKLRIKHERLANLIKKQPIFIDRLTEEHGYYNTNAKAYKPAHGWQDYTSDEHYDAIMANPRYFVISLGCSWFDSPIYAVDAHAPSKFQILVHELSHLFICARDHRYGYNRCILYGMDNSIMAKTNADSWGYFASACRLHHRTIIDDDGLESTRM